MYKTLPIEQLRIIRNYLIHYEKQTPYILHQQDNNYPGESQ